MDNCFTAAEPFLRFANFIGLFPMSFRGPARKGSLKAKWKDFIPTFCLCLLLIITIAVSLIKKSFVKSNSILLVYGWKISNCTIYISMLMLAGYQAWKTKNVLKFLKQVDDADTKVRKCRCDPQEVHQKSFEG